MGISIRQRTARKDKKIFFYVTWRILYRQDKNKQKHNYTKISSMIKVYGDIDTAKKRPEKDNTLYKYMWISRKQKTAKKMTIHFTFKLDPL